MAGLIDVVLLVLEIIVFADVILSWVKPNPYEFPRNLTTQVTDPLCAPIRKLIDPQKLGGLDLSPMIIILILSFMRRMLAGAL